MAHNAQNGMIVRCRHFPILLIVCSVLFPLAAQAKATWRVMFDRRAHAFTILYGKQTVIRASVPMADFGPERVMASELPEVSTQESRLAHPVFGTCRTLVYSFSDGNHVMTQTFHILSEGVVTMLTLSMADGSLVESNYLSPLSTDINSIRSQSRFLKVPYDNDNFVRYHVLPADTTAVSYEVGALFGGRDRGGIVIGSIDHDRWKSAVAISNGRLTAFSGVSTDETHDILPHGSLRGQQVSSARFLVTASDDWRTAMECFAKTCNLVLPGRRQWLHGTPFGWQSWGVLAEKNSFQTDLEISDYMAQTLRPAGFCAQDGTQVLSIDAWDNLSASQKRELCRHAKDNGQVPGTYVTPFCLWWNESALDRPLFRGSEWTGRDACLRINGKPHKYDGAFCLDPTHPATHAFFAQTARSLKEAGFEYFKIDFTSNGMIQADEYYDKSIRTAVEAYNYGFRRFIEELDRGGQVFTALSIAPIFPSHYGNSRRIACDTWGRIDQSEYAMNAITYGWWTSLLYQFNDPDHLVLVGKEAATGNCESEAENRSRFTTGVISGMVLVPDVWSLNDQSGRGDARLSIERAQKILMNNDINQVARLGQAFKPLPSFSPSYGRGGGREAFAFLPYGKTLFLAAINFSTQPLTTAIPLKDLDLRARDIVTIRELWTGSTIQFPDSHTKGDPEESLSITIPTHDARLYRIELR